MDNEMRNTVFEEVIKLCKYCISITFLQVSEFSTKHHTQLV